MRRCDKWRSEVTRVLGSVGSCVVKQADNVTADHCARETDHRAPPHRLDTPIRLSAYPPTDPPTLVLSQMMRFSNISRCCTSYSHLLFRRVLEEQRVGGWARYHTTRLRLAVLASIVQDAHEWTIQQSKKCSRTSSIGQYLKIDLVRAPFI